MKRDPRTTRRRQVKRLIYDLVRSALANGLDLEEFALAYGCTEDQLEREIKRQLDQLHRESLG